MKTRTLLELSLLIAEKRAIKDQIMVFTQWLDNNENDLTDQDKLFVYNTLGKRLIEYAEKSINNKAKRLADKAIRLTAKESKIHKNTNTNTNTNTSKEEKKENIERWAFTFKSRYRGRCMNENCKIGYCEAEQPTFFAHMSDGTTKSCHIECSPPEAKNVKKFQELLDSGYELKKPDLQDNEEKEEIIEPHDEDMIPNDNWEPHDEDLMGNDTEIDNLKTCPF